MKISELLSYGYKTLKETGIDSYLLDTQLLLQKVLEVDKLFIIMNKELEIDIEKQKEFFRIIELRKNKMPIKYITGHCEFMGLDFLVKEGILIPRPDTELLVEEVIKLAKTSNCKRICDVCSGSGAIGISLAYFLGNIQVFCSDLSTVACEVTEENSKRLLGENKIKVFQSDLLKFAKGDNMKFDIIVSNPPYIRDEIIGTLMEDVRGYEPLMALSGGEDGLEFYRRITAESLEILEESGILAFEIGYDQAVDVRNIMEANNYKNINIFQDLAGLDRVVIGNR